MDFNGNLGVGPDAQAPDTSYFFDSLGARLDIADGTLPARLNRLDNTGAATTLALKSGVRAVAGAANNGPFIAFRANNASIVDSSTG